MEKAGKKNWCFLGGHTIINSQTAGKIISQAGEL